MSEDYKVIKVFVKGEMGIGKTTFITCVRDLLKKNKKFKELFDRYNIEVFEIATTSDDTEYRSASNKMWSITDGKLEEKEFITVTYRKSFIATVWSTIKSVFVKLFKFIFRIK